MLATSTTLSGRVWALVKPYWFSEEKWQARGLLAAVIAINLGLVYITVLLNKWNNDFYNALQNKDSEAFFHQILYFSVLASIYIIAAVYQINLNLLLQIRWRRWLTGVYFEEWLGNGVYYRMELKNYGTDNPDQRIQEDLKIFTSSTLSLGLGLMRSVVSLFSFVFILWSLSGALTIPFNGSSLVIPGYMVWAALLYAIGGTWLVHRIGRPLIGLNFDQQRFEADLRYGMIRVRENAEGVALYRGERDETRGLWQRFNKVWGNWLQLIKYQKRLIGFTAFYEQLASIFPFVVAAPRYFSGAMQLGGLMQTASAFGRVQDALSWFISAYSSLAEWRATVDRLTGFHQAIVNAGAESRGKHNISASTNSTGTLSTAALNVELPDGKPLLNALDLTFSPKQNVVVTGASGSGKSTLFRALAGIWPFGEGTVSLPRDASIMFLPQKPYLPAGTLREALSYPSGPTEFGDEKLREALHLCRLEELSAHLNESDNWTMRLSPGEQQRLAIARALLNRPQWLFMDEATASLDEQTEEYLYQLLRDWLPDTTLVSIAHRPALTAHHQRRMEIARDNGGAHLVSEALSPA